MREHHNSHSTSKSSVFEGACGPRSILPRAVLSASLLTPLKNKPIRGHETGGAEHVFKNTGALTQSDYWLLHRAESRPQRACSHFYFLA